MLVREPGPRYLIHGSKGSFIKSGEDPQEAKLRAGEMPTENLGKEPEDLYGLLHTEIEGEVVREKRAIGTGRLWLVLRRFVQHHCSRRTFENKA